MRCRWGIAHCEDGRFVIDTYSGLTSGLAGRIWVAVLTLSLTIVAGLLYIEPIVLYSFERLICWLAGSFALRHTKELLPAASEPVPVLASDTSGPQFFFLTVPTAINHTMPAQTKRKQIHGGGDTDADQVLQAVILSDSFNSRFMPLTYEKPRVCCLSI